MFGNVGIDGAFFVTMKGRWFRCDWQTDMGCSETGPGQPRTVDLRGGRLCNERSTGTGGKSFDVKERRGTRSTGSGWRCFAVGRRRLLSCLVGEEMLLEGKGTPAPAQV